MMVTSQTALDWLSAALNRITKNLQTVSSHIHHTDLSERLAYCTSFTCLNCKSDADEQEWHLFVLLQKYR